MNPDAIPFTFFFSDLWQLDVSIGDIVVFSNLDYVLQYSMY